MKMKNKLSQTRIQSESSSNIWVITEYDDNSWACSCPKWKFHRGDRVNCKHILQIKNERRQTEIVVSGIKEIEVENEIREH
jgi:predicted nucleic acid-binding Zn finger protein